MPSPPDLEDPSLPGSGILRGRTAGSDDDVSHDGVREPFVGSRPGSGPVRGLENAAGLFSVQTRTLDLLIFANLCENSRYFFLDHTRFLVSNMGSWRNR